MELRYQLQAEHEDTLRWGTQNGPALDSLLSTIKIQHTIYKLEK